MVGSLEKQERGRRMADSLAEERLQLDYRNIMEYTKNTLEYLFVDKAEVIPGKEAWGTKLSSSQDWYYKMHFPGNPVMPGVLMEEVLQTTGSFIIYTMAGKKDIQLFYDSSQMKMHHSVRPGDVITAHVVLDRYRLGVGKFHGEAYVGNKLICRTEFTLIAPKEFPGREKNEQTTGR